MKITLALLGIVVLVGVGYVFMQQSEGQIVPTSEAVEEDVSSVDEVSSDAGRYEPYSPEKLSHADVGDVVLFFRASWCPTCKILDTDIRANLNAIPAGMTILDVDYDTSTELKQKYGVTYQHTFVQVNADGTQIKKWSGSPTLAALVAEVQ